VIRVATIIGVLLAGLLGLFMSVCGGGFFIGFTYSGVEALFKPMPRVNLADNLPAMALAAAFAVGGGFLFWKCVKYLRKQMAARADDDERNAG